MQLIATRTFTLEDQQAFAALSGDCNPLHMDPEVARKTQAGAPAVHGMHALLWALETYLSWGGRDLRSVAARFEHFITIDAPVELHVRPGEASTKIELRFMGGRSALITASHGERAGGLEPVEVQAEPLVETPVVLTFEEAATSQGAFHLREGDPGVAFPRLSAVIGRACVLGVAGLSTLVGMVSPGLHSILSSAAITFRADTQSTPILSYRAVSSHEAFKLVTFETRGPGFTAEVDAFLRPAPVRQLDYQTLRAAPPVVGLEAVSALVVGGSRGLGELTAKILAAGGAEVCITYAVGKADAEKVAAEITAGGGICSIAPYDARLPVADQLDGLPLTPNQVYYFATSKIFRQKPGLFTTELFDEFIQIYVRGFYELCRTFNTKRPARIFYPSSTAVADRPRDMTEYAMAKAASEALAVDIDRFMPGVKVLQRRLPRLATDQTASVTEVETASSFEILTEIVQAMNV